MCKLPLSYMVISDVHRSFLLNKTTFTKYCLTQWSSKLPGSFEIHWAWSNEIHWVIRQYLVNFHRSGRRSKGNCLQDRANFHRSRAWQIVLIFHTVTPKYSAIHLGSGLGWGVLKLHPLSSLPKICYVNFCFCKSIFIHWISLIFSRCHNS